MGTIVGMTRRAISVDKAVKSVLCPSAGGTAVFIGTVRNKSDGHSVSGLEFESAEDLATTDLKAIADAAATKFDVCKLTVRHRIGKMRVGEVIVVIAVSAPHRKDAFAACRYVIDELKKSTPIWKKEISGRKQRWVEAV